ncbi:rna-binding protein [hydrocarbon metagenome]|uniref:Rna-binding protein n=1 Tax=hydrocarbon metagenome TaxID=938273 RepID=A0A0W8G186_9ZZZZ
MDVSDELLLNTFSKFGKVTSATVIRDMFTQQSKGFGFVEMPSKTEAEEAIQKLNTEELNGKRIVVNVARPKRDRPRRR